MTIRDYREGDHFAVAEIFPRAVHEIASQVYSQKQCEAWSAREPNPEHWKKRCEQKRPFVAVVNSQIAGFLELEPDGHIDCAYVNPDYQRQGIMTQLVRHALEEASRMNLSRLYVEASICAKPLFEREGFVVVSEKNVNIGGVELCNFDMELRDICVE